MLARSNSLVSPDVKDRNVQVAFLCEKWKRDLPRLLPRLAVTFGLVSIIIIVGEVDVRMLNVQKSFTSYMRYDSSL